MAPTTDLQVPFGSVTAGSSANQTVTVTNSGNAALTVGAVGSTNPIAAPFSITNDMCSNQTIAPSASCTMRITFAPVAAGTFSDGFNIPSNDPAKASVIVNISGTGATAALGDITVTDPVTPVDDHQIPFGTVREGRSVDDVVTVTNAGSGQLVMGSIGLNNTLAGPFSIASDLCSSKTLAAGGTCTITVRFAPPTGCANASGTGTSGTSVTASVNTCTYSDSFDIPSNDPDMQVVTVQVSGSGVSNSANNNPRKPKPRYPANLQKDLETIISMQWEEATDPDGDAVSYELRLATDQAFSSPIVAKKAATGTSGTLFAGTGAGFIVFGIAFMSTARGRKGLLLIAVLTVLVGTALVGCGASGSNGSQPSGASPALVSRQVSGLQTSTTYYWKVIATDGNGGVAESDVMTFTTK
ncbi:MAG: choice-of-anchor D domain-containing protein [Nitrospirae bacterium]|nr:choice-of-anchor D domain-containing protein [Nitrospirota bacterium]